MGEAPPDTAAPPMGLDTEQVLHDLLGLSADGIARLCADGVVRLASDRLPA